MTAARIHERRVRRQTITLSACLLTGFAVLPGCSFWADNVVAENYAPADGLSADLPDLKVRNLLVVASEAGPAVLSASMFNQTSAPLTVRITVGEGALDTTVDVPADGRLTLTGAAAPEGDAAAATEVVVVEDLSVPPGGAVSIGITSPGWGTVTRTAPVVLDEGPYEGFLPTSAPSAS